MKASRMVFPWIGIVLMASSGGAQDNADLEKRLQVLESKVALMEECSLVEEVGAVVVTIPAGKTGAIAQIKFKRPQSQTPVVLTGESGSGGSWVITKAQAINNSGCQIAILYFNGKPQSHAPYVARIGYVVLRSEGEPTVVKPATPPNPQPAQRMPQPASPTWAQYRADCGEDAQERNEAKTEEIFRQKYKGKTVCWSGTVVSTSEGFLSSDYTVTVRMAPSDAMFSDIVLHVPQKMKTFVLSLNEGDAIAFEGTLRFQGGPLSSHTIDVAKLSKQ